MGLIVKPNTFSAGATIIASEHNSNFDTIYNEFNGNIQDTNLSLSASIQDNKLSQISTGGKVNGSALTSLANIPTGAGVIPLVHLASGTTGNNYYLKGDGTWASGNTANQAVILDSSQKLPAVDGSQLTGIINTSYDSGWFSISTGTGYTKTHNLGSTKVITMIYISPNSDGSVSCVGGLAPTGITYQTWSGTWLAELTTTTISIRTGDTYLAWFKDKNGNELNPTSGYARIIMLLLP